MKFSLIRLFCQGAIVLAAVQNVSVAGPLSLEILRAQAAQYGMVSGRFLQCTMHGGALISGSGKFTVDPGKRVEMNFDHPNSYSISFFKNGQQKKTVGGLEQKSPRYSSFGKLIFSLMSMNASSLSNLFEVDLSGTVDQFSIFLLPKKRLSKALQSAEIEGAAGLLNKLQLTTRDNRTISIYLSPFDDPIIKTCD